MSPRARVHPRASRRSSVAASTSSSSLSSRAGYTLVEVMVALAVMAIGVSGILSMQNASILANRRAQEMTTATNIARRWQERLRADTLLWNSPSQINPLSDLARDTQYLCALVGCASGSAGLDNQWFVPSPRPGGTDSPAFDAFGNEVPLGDSRTRYCTNIRLTWARVETAGRSGVIRADVRVWWYREGVAQVAAYANCGGAPGAGLEGLGADVSTVHQVYLSTSLMGTPL